MSVDEDFRGAELGRVYQCVVGKLKILWVIRIDYRFYVKQCFLELGLIELDAPWNCLLSRKHVCYSARTSVSWTREDAKTRRLEGS